MMLCKSPPPVYLSVQAYISCVDGTCLVVDAKHDLGNGVGRNAILVNDGVAQNSVFCHWVVCICGCHCHY